MDLSRCDELTEAAVVMKDCHIGRKLKALERRKQSNELSVRESFYLFFLFDSPASLDNSPRHWRLVQTLMREKKHLQEKRVEDSDQERGKKRQTNQSQAFTKTK